MLLQKISEVLRRLPLHISLPGGRDEFVILLPKKLPGKGRQIIARVQTEFSQEQVKAIRATSPCRRHQAFSGDNIFECQSREPKKDVAP
jgi:hypothetical protein